VRGRAPVPQQAVGLVDQEDGAEEALTMLARGVYPTVGCVVLATREEIEADRRLQAACR
jgi:hypothetical protein